MFFSGEPCPRVTVYDPTIGTDPVQTRTQVHSLELTLTDHPLIIAIAPK